MKRHPQLLELSREHHTALSLAQRGQLPENLERTALRNLITQTLRTTPEPDALPETAAEAPSA